MLDKQQEALRTMNEKSISGLFDEVSVLDEVSMDDIFIIIAMAFQKMDSVHIIERDYEGVTGVRLRIDMETIFDVYPEPHEHANKDKWANKEKVSHIRLIKVHKDMHLAREVLDVYSQVNPQKYIPTGNGVMIYEDIVLNYGKSIEEMVDIVTRFYRNSTGLVTAKYMQTSSVN